MVTGGFELNTYSTDHPVLRNVEVLTNQSEEALLNNLNVQLISQKDHKLKLGLL